LPVLIVAFDNTAGGSIIIGRDDNGDIAGVEDPLQIDSGQD
jgi:predicted HTH transcriptional regulator